MPVSCIPEKSSEETSSFLASRAGAGRRNCDHEEDDDDEPFYAGESLGFAQLESMMADAGNVSVHGFSAQSLRFLEGSASPEETVQQRLGRQGTGRIDGLPAGIDLLEGPEGYGAMLRGQFKSAGNDPQAFMRALLWAVTAGSAVKVTSHLITRELNNLADFVENHLADKAVSTWWRSTQWGRDGKPPSSIMDDLAAGKLAWNCDLTRLVCLYLGSGDVSEIFRAATSSAPHSTPAANPQGPGEARAESSSGSSGPQWGEQANWEFFKERRWAFFTPDDSGYGFRGTGGYIPSEADGAESDVDEEDDGCMTLPIFGFRVKRQTVRNAMNALMLTGNVVQEIQRFNAVPPPPGGYARSDENFDFDPDEEMTIEVINEEGIPVRERSNGEEYVVDQAKPEAAAAAPSWLHENLDDRSRVEGWLAMLGSALLIRVSGWKSALIDTLEGQARVAPIAVSPERTYSDLSVDASLQYKKLFAEMHAENERQAVASRAAATGGATGSMKQTSSEQDAAREEAAQQEALDELMQLKENWDEGQASLFGGSAYIYLRGILCNVHAAVRGEYEVHMHLNQNMTKALDLSNPLVLVDQKKYYPVVRSEGIPSAASLSTTYPLVTYFRDPDEPSRETKVTFHFGHRWPPNAAFFAVLESVAALFGRTTPIGTTTDVLAKEQREVLHKLIVKLADSAHLANYYFEARNDPAGKYVPDSQRSITLTRNKPVALQSEQYYASQGSQPLYLKLEAPVDIEVTEVFRLFDFGQLAFDNGISTYKIRSTSPREMSSWWTKKYYTDFSSFHPVTRQETIWTFISDGYWAGYRLINILKMLISIKNVIPGGARINPTGWHWSGPAVRLAQSIPSQFVLPRLIAGEQTIGWHIGDSRIDIQHPWYFDQPGANVRVLLPSELTTSNVFHALDLGQLSDANGASLYSNIQRPREREFTLRDKSVVRLFVVEFRVKDRTGKKQRKWRIFHRERAVVERVEKLLTAKDFLEPGPINAQCVNPRVVFAASTEEKTIFDMLSYELYSSPGEQYEVILSPESGSQDAKSEDEFLLRLPDRLYDDDGMELIRITTDCSDIGTYEAQFSMCIAMVPHGANPDNSQRWINFAVKSESELVLNGIKNSVRGVMHQSVVRRAAHLEALFEGNISRNPAFAHVHSDDKPLPWNKLTKASKIKHLIIEFVDIDGGSIEELFEKMDFDKLQFIETRIGRARELAFYYKVDNAYRVPVIIIGANEWSTAELLKRTRGNDPMQNWRSTLSDGATERSAEPATLPSLSPDLSTGSRIVLWEPAQNRLDIPENWSGTAFLAQPAPREGTDWGDVSDVQVTVQEPFFRRTDIGGEIVMCNEDGSRCLFIQRGHGDNDIAQAIAKASEPEAKALLKSSLLSSAKRGVSIPAHAFSALQSMDNDRALLFEFVRHFGPPIEVSDVVEKYRVFFKDVFPDQIYFTVFGKDDNDLNRLSSEEAAERVLIAMEIFDFRTQLSKKSPRDWRVALRNQKSPLSLVDWVKVRPLLLSHTGLRKLERLCKAKGLSKCQSIAGGQSSKIDRGNQAPVAGTGAPVDGTGKAEADRIFAALKTGGREFNDIDLHNASADDGRIKTLAVAKMVVFGTAGTGAERASVRMVGSGLVSLGSLAQLSMASPPEGGGLSQTAGWTSIAGTAGLTLSYGTYALLDDDSPQLAIWVETAAVSLLIISNGAQTIDDVLSFFEDPSWMGSFVVVKDASNLVSALASVPEGDAFLMRLVQSSGSNAAESATPVSRQDIATNDGMAAFDEEAVDFTDVSTLYSEEEIDAILPPELADAIGALMEFTDPAGVGEGVVFADSLEQAMEIWTYVREVEAVAEVIPGVGLVAEIAVEGVIATISQYLLEIAVGTAAVGALMGTMESEAKQLQNVKAQAQERLKSKEYSVLDESKLGTSHAKVLKELQERFKEDVVEELQTNRKLIEACKAEHGGIFRKVAYGTRLVIEHAIQSYPLWDALVQSLAADVQRDILTEASKSAENVVEQQERWAEAISSGFAINSPDNLGGSVGQGEVAARVVEALNIWEDLMKLEESIRSIHLPDCNAIITGNANTIVYHGKLDKH